MTAEKLSERKNREKKVTRDKPREITKPNRDRDGRNQQIKIERIRDVVFLVTGVTLTEMLREPRKEAEKGERWSETL